MQFDNGSTSDQSRSVISVSSLNAMAKNVLAREIGTVWLSGEVSNFVAAASGHWYFSLKDNKAQVKAAMFRGANTRVKTKPKNGDNIIVRANISLYEPRGDYQIIVEFMEQDGEGLLKQQFDALKNQLMAEGLFATQTKQALPKDICTVGVVTSSSGAALHDILTVLARRNPSIRVIVYPTQVQGATAAAQIVKAIHIANKRNEVDILIVGRGGGSLEDLWCFNEESVAREIFSSRLPIVSAVGHEVDVTIADFVADMRAATPSQAAELVSQDQRELQERLSQTAQRLHHLMQQRVMQTQYRLETRIAQLNQHHPRAQLERQAQRADQLEISLKQHMANLLVNKQQQLSQQQQGLAKHDPKALLAQHQQTVTTLSARLARAQQQLLSKRELQLSRLADLLNSVSPLATLGRGYSITKRGEQVITRAAELSAGDAVTLKYADGEVAATIK